MQTLTTDGNAQDPAAAQLAANAKTDAQRKAA
jgi:hypothetical protein